MNSKLKRVLAVALAGSLAGASLAGCGSKGAPQIDGTKTVLTVNGEEISLGLLSFYARYQQAEGVQMATYYGLSTGAAIYDNLHEESTSSGTVEVTLGESTKADTLENVERMVLLRQHAEEYGVSLSDETQQAIDEAAQSYIDSNDEAALALVGADKDDVAELMALQQIRNDMLAPLAEEINQEVSDEEAQQTSVSYAYVQASSFMNTSEDTQESGAESAEAVDEEEANQLAEAKAQEVLDALLAEEDPSTADLTAVAQSIDEGMSSFTGQFAANDLTDTYLDSSIVEAVQGMEDGTVVQTVVENSEGGTYYIVRLDKNFDEDLTATEKENIITQRKTDNLEAHIEEWREASEITVDEEVWATLVISGAYAVTFKTAVQSESSVDAAAAESIAEAVIAEGTAAASGESEAESAAESAESSESAAGSSESAAESKE
ncbi:MAG: hypothetical protein Q4B15_05705 [Lachnospiraceae bacterium]|nr:hypothetical protein [Lachnospiraceae bacterium]